MICGSLFLETRAAQCSSGSAEACTICWHLQGTLLYPLVGFCSRVTSFPFCVLGKFTPVPVQLWSNFCALPQKHKIIGTNLYSILKIDLLPERKKKKMGCRNRKTVYVIINNLQQSAGKNYSSWLLACWVEQPERLHYRYQTWWPQQIQ